MYIDYLRFFFGNFAGLTCLKSLRQYKKNLIES